MSNGIECLVAEDDASDDLNWSIGTFEVEDGNELCGCSKEVGFDPAKGGVSRKAVSTARRNNPNIPMYVMCPMMGERKTSTSDNLETRSALIRRRCRLVAQERTEQAILAENKFISGHLGPYLIMSALSQQALQDFDRQQGLPASHARTMLRSKRTRDQLLEGMLFF